MNRTAPPTHQAGNENSVWPSSPKGVRRTYGHGPDAHQQLHDFIRSTSRKAKQSTTSSSTPLKRKFGIRLVQLTCYTRPPMLLFLKARGFCSVVSLAALLWCGGLYDNWCCRSSTPRGLGLRSVVPRGLSRKIVTLVAALLALLSVPLQRKTTSPLRLHDPPPPQIFPLPSKSILIEQWQGPTKQ
jgi:hypothetical protein